MNKQQMSDTIKELMLSKDYTDLADRAQFLAGMKLGLITACSLCDDEVIDLVDVVFEWQKKFDPEGITWDKEAAEQSI